ncbi:MAG: hypothetical protein KKD94_05025, partial [Nanoarchaeota archaeon]|nr:hypothetical protein [Nanoarchaeota archaeon]
WANAVLVFFVLLFSFAVVSADSYSDLFNNGLIVQANVTDTKELRINFVPVDYSSLFSLMFVSAANNNSAFINATYPLAEGKYVPTFSSEMNFSSNIEELTLFNQCSLLKRIYRFGRVSGSDYDRVVGIVPNNWFAEHGDPIGAGYSCGGLFGNIKAILIEDYFRHGAAHEVGHTLGDVGGVLRKIGLCDEYNSDVWENQDSILDRCPNGDSNPDNGELFVH